MSKISTVYDQILTVMDGLFTGASGYTRIPYAYDLALNNDNFLRKGWGVKIGESSANEQLEWCRFTVNHTISVVFTREVFNTGSNAEGFDDIALGLVEDIYTVQARFYSPDQLGIETQIVKIDAISTTAVEQITGDKIKFLTREATFNFIIQESI